MSAEDLLSLDDYIKNNIPAHIFPLKKVMAYSNYETALAEYIVEG